MLYFDSSALVKLVVTEAESTALKDFLAFRPGDPVTSSALARVEVPRALHGYGGKAYRAATRLLNDVEQIPLSRELLDEAAAQPTGLRSLDAIHLTSARLLLPELTAFVAYDRRLLDSAEKFGLPVESPGA